MIVTLPLALFRFDKRSKTLIVTSEHFQRRFPQEFYILSHHTNKKIKFKQDTASAERHEFWDGEQMEYIPESPDSVKNVSKVVIYHG